MKKRVLSMVLVLIMTLTMMPSFNLTVSAAVTETTDSINMYNLYYMTGSYTNGLNNFNYLSPIVSGTDNSPTITFPQKDERYPEGSVGTAGTVTSKYTMDFTRSFNIEGEISFASRDGIGFALHNNSNKKSFAPYWSTSMLGQSYENLSINTTYIPLNSQSNDIEKGLLWEFMQINFPTVNGKRAYNGAYSYKIDSINSMRAFPDDDISGNGAYGIKNYGLANQDSEFSLAWECIDNVTATGKLVMTMGGSTFTYSNLCAKDVFGSIDNAKSVYFTMSAFAPPYKNGAGQDDSSKTTSITINKAYYKDSVGVEGSTLGISTKYYIDTDLNGSYETQITGNRTVDPNQKVLVRNVITNQNRNAKGAITTSLLTPNFSVSNGTIDTKINSVSDQKFYWKEHNGIETLRDDMYKSIGNGPFNTNDIYNDYAQITIPEGGDGINVYDDAYAIYEYVVSPNSDSKVLKQTIQIGVAPFTPKIINSEISFEKSVKSIVSLNTPVFTNDKTGYSFKRAIINNFTGISSITFSASKSTTVQYIPTFLTPSSKLESIDGDTRTFTYVFKNSISVSEAEEFIRGIIFNYVSGSEITITVDNNVNNLPDGAKITEFAHPDGTNHYYMYVPSNFISWTSAYNLAKSYRYMGLKGYLATITSEEEDKILTNISTISAWSAGTRYLNSDGSKLADPESIFDTSKTAAYYYWACGPEAETIYYNSTYPTQTPGEGYTGYNGAYNNWGANPKQPDADTSGETCMQVNWPLDIGASNKMRWNDLPNEGLPQIGLVKGYFVEFSKYATGVDSTYASDKTAVETYNIAKEGGIEEGLTIMLNSPVYGSDKSVFSFDNAEITNSSKIYSLTVKLDNYTNILSKSNTPVPSKELSNIAGTANIITYEFKDGITETEAESFLRGLKFRYGGLKASSTTNVSVTVDGNETNLPDNATVTEFNGHYYMYVPGKLQWQDTYNLAKTYTYMGLRGYLATITSPEEDNILTQISNNGAWSAGSALMKLDGNKINDEITYELSTNNVGNEYYWTCGPEAGTVYFTSRMHNWGIGVGYNNWASAQPDNYHFGLGRGGIEFCMQVNYMNPFIGSKKGWNDLNNDPIQEPGLYPSGYFVEFSDYSNGRVDNYMASANGKSNVPIIVEKGDVFNTIKDGETYYVDTLLTTFDRNIDKITINNLTVSKDYILSGNKNITYNIFATDLEGNTATIIITMKTIASILEPIKNLTVNNVQMINKDSILAVKEALKAIDQTTASEAQKIEIANGIQNCNNLYFALFNATSTVTNGTNGWYKAGIDNITLNSPDGFKIRTSSTTEWRNSINLDKVDAANKIVTYYLKETSTEEISDEKTFSYKVDTVAPIGEITIKNNKFKDFLSKITFGFFFKNITNVTISGSDTLSNPVTISYQKVKASESYNENGNWTEGTSFSVGANEKFSVYAKIKDNAGNTSIINTDGIVVYTNSTQETSNISFTRTSTTDGVAKVNLNGNIINEIKNGEAIIENSNYSVTPDGTITFKASYLDTLSVGTYTLNISYNPMGENYISDTSIGDVPETTTITLAIKAKDMSDQEGNPGEYVTVTPDSYTYDGGEFDPIVTVKDGAKTLTENTDYTISHTEDMINVGKKILTITFKGIYSGVVRKEVIISEASIVDTSAIVQSTTYNGDENTIFVASGTTVDEQNITVKYSMDDGITYTSDTIPKFTDAGSYIVYYKLSAPNHKETTGQINFTVNPATDNIISGLTLEGWIYGDKENTPKATAVYGTPIFTYSNSEDGTYTKTLPTNAGAYFVKAIIEKTPNYNNCEAKASFIISDKNISDNDIIVSGFNDYYIFTDRDITPEPIIMVGENTLVKDIDYTISYENNKNIGKNAKIIITLKGNYSGRVEKDFEIRYGSISEDEIKSMITIPEYNLMGWYKEDIIITAKGEFTICKTTSGTFDDSLRINQESRDNGTEYTFYIKAADGRLYKSKLNYKLDKTPPVILGVVDGETYYTTQKITIKDENLDTVTVNGKDFVSGDNILGNKNETYKIVAKDKAGNIMTINIIMKPINKLDDNIKDISEDNVKAEDNDEIQVVKKKIEAVDTTNATSEEKKELQEIIDKCNRLLKIIEDNSKEATIPQTGDNSRMKLWIALMLLSSGFLVNLDISKKRRKNSVK